MNPRLKLPAIEEKSYEPPNCYGQLQGAAADIGGIHLEVLHESKYFAIAGGCRQR